MMTFHFFSPFLLSFLSLDQRGAAVSASVPLAFARPFLGAQPIRSGGPACRWPAARQSGQR